MSSDRTPAEALARARWDRELEPDHPWHVAWDDVSPRLRQEQVEFAEADIELLAAAGFRVVPIPDDNTRALAARARSLLDAATPRPWATYYTIHGEPFVTLPGLPITHGIAAVSTGSLDDKRDDYGRANAELIAAAPTLIAELLAALLDGQPEDRPAQCPTCGWRGDPLDQLRHGLSIDCSDPWHVGGSGDTR